MRHETLIEPWPENHIVIANEIFFDRRLFHFFRSWNQIMGELHSKFGITITYITPESLWDFFSKKGVTHG